MKYRESGMPAEQLWQTFFEPTDILNKMEINRHVNILLDIGCGYGTFLLPAAKLVTSKVVGIDIDTDMIGVCREKVKIAQITNVELINGDICSEATTNEIQPYQGVIDYITLFNMLHCEGPLDLLKKVYKLLNNGGKLGIIHWKYEETPRGPSMAIRPKAEMIMDWAAKTGFKLIKQVDLPPYHFGLIFLKDNI
jgi:SAM-dependent methyltransferase